jgi:hypothetical protein
MSSHSSEGKEVDLLTTLLELTGWDLEEKEDEERTVLCFKKKKGESARSTIFIRGV